ncbi:winged helix-turn-helix domain-containing protein [Deinococcus knuensis]|uniref:OmpR/PhoB-type domain-containing protein n=1 Tax=Deinococcus knuensis TaxID=1837380 RepID=A0ABQ2SEK9_9DEIO|nr:helix-turn-helix domain-containing protein [Deinococcus knuensis]GGS25851.1 hypothetical protein GCM10008961_16670 [Deinococcus knuensis]
MNSKAAYGRHSGSSPYLKAGASPELLGEGSERTIDVHVRNLRAKLAADPARPALLETVYGVGYRLGGS